MYSLSRRQMLGSLFLGTAAVGFPSLVNAQDGRDIKDLDFAKISIAAIASEKFVRPGMIGTQLDVMRHVWKDPWVKDADETVDDNNVRREKLPVIDREQSPAIETHENIHALIGNVLDQVEKHPKYKYSVSIRNYRGKMCTTSGNQMAYLGDGKGAIVKTPCGISITHAGYAVPSFATRNTTFQDYFIDKNLKSIKEGGIAPFPAILIQEASAYLLHGRVSLENAKTHEHYTDFLVSKKYKVGETEAAGQFVIYLLALGAEIEKRERSGQKVYVNNEDRDQMYGVIKHLVEGLADVYQQGMNKERYPHLAYYDSNYLETLDKDYSQSSQSIKAFASRVCGRDWLRSLRQDEVAKELVVIPSNFSLTSYLSHSETPQLIDPQMMPELQR